MIPVTSSLNHPHARPTISPASWRWDVPSNSLLYANLSHHNPAKPVAHQLPSPQTATPPAHWAPRVSSSDDHAVGKPHSSTHQQQQQYDSHSTHSVRFPQTPANEACHQQHQQAPRPLLPTLISSLQQYQHVQQPTTRPQQPSQIAAAVTTTPVNPATDPEIISAATILLSVRTRPHNTGAIRRQHLRIDTSPLAKKSNEDQPATHAHLPTPSQTPSQSPRRIAAPHSYTLPIPPAAPSKDRRSDATDTDHDTYFTRRQSPAPAPIATIIADPRRRLGTLLKAERASVAKSHVKGWMDYGDDGDDVSDFEDTRRHRPYGVPLPYIPKPKRNAAAAPVEVDSAAVEAEEARLSRTAATTDRPDHPPTKRAKLSIAGCAETAICPPLRHRAPVSPPASNSSHHPDSDEDLEARGNAIASPREDVSSDRADRLKRRASDASSAGCVTAPSKKRSRASGSDSQDDEGGAGMKSTAALALQRKSCKIPTLPAEVDMGLYRDTSKAQVVQWPKGGPMTFSPDTPMLPLLTREEATLCRTLRLLPEQYLKIKDAVIGGTYTCRPFKKKEVRRWFPIDVNKINKLYDWFLDLGWIPVEDSEWEARREWLRGKGGDVAVETVAEE
ncbi:hypothetical protein HK101_008937 [Irineochytrium annulatum]|nr:hypothetical protein HK101_008937 [Irineochytrium annulatum]